MQYNRPTETAREIFKLKNWNRRHTPLVRPVVFGLILTFVIFGAYEVVERAWLTGVEMQTLHRLHMLRGIFSSLVVAGVVGWMIIKASPSFLETAPANEEWTSRPRVTDEERALMYARWFIAMRWVAALLSGILVLISVHLIEWLPREVWWPLTGIVGTLVVSNLVYVLMLRRKRFVSALLPLQGHVDLVILTLLLHFSGGVENPLSTMMLFHVIIGGILLRRQQCYWLAAMASILFALMVGAEWSGVVRHYTLEVFPHTHGAHGQLVHAAHHPLFALSRACLQTAMLFLTAFFVTSLSERLRENEGRLEVLARRALAGQQLLERALDTTGAGLRVLDDALESHWANSRWTRWFVSPPDSKCQGSEMLNGDGAPARLTRHDGKVRVTEINFAEGTRPSGDQDAQRVERVFQVTTAPLLDLDGKIAQIVELAQDVTEQKKTQTRILQAGKLAAVGEMAGQVAHEVNNPVSIISAKASLLLTDHRAGMSPKVAEELAKISDLARRVARVAQGLLSYCRPSAATRVRLDLRVPIRKSLGGVEERANHDGVRLEDQLPVELPVVKGNANELEQVFLNLFLNALDAMPKGGWLSISMLPGEVRLHDGRPAVGVVVADTGCGMSDTISEKVFEPFFTTKTEGRGTGLGLSICLGVVRSHGGELEIESKLWQGTRVIVKLPVDAPAVKEENCHG